MTTANSTLFPADPKHNDIFELRAGLLYQYDATVNSWIRIVSSNLVLPMADDIADGAMSALDLKKLNRLVIPPPQSTIVGNDCIAPFKAGAIGLYGGDNFVNVEGDVSLQNIDSVGDVINEEFPFHIHQHTYGYDFNLDIPRLVAELIKRGQLDVRGEIGTTGDKGHEGDPGLDQVTAGTPGAKGEQGFAPECELTLEQEPVQAETQPGLERALVTARVIPSVSFPSDPLKYAIEFDRQVIGVVDASTNKFIVRQQDSLWVLAVPSITGTKQDIFYLDIEPLVEAVRQKFLTEVELLKKGYEDIVAFWIQTMSDLFDEQKDALCCAIECCKSRSKSTQLRQHMESTAAAALPNARIKLNARKSGESSEIPSTTLLINSECYDPRITADEVCGKEEKFDKPGIGIVPCDSGMDLVFVIDDTGSMGGVIQNMKTQVDAYVSHISGQSSGNYRLGLITFKDNVSVRLTMSDLNSEEFKRAIDELVASGGDDAPEAHVEATQAAVSGSAGAWRAGKAKIIIVITDQIPSAGDAAAAVVANTAKEAGIHISAILTSNVSGAEASLKNYASVTGGVFVKSSGTAGSAAVIESLTLCAPSTPSPDDPDLELPSPGDPPLPDDPDLELPLPPDVPPPPPGLFDVPEGAGASSAFSASLAVDPIVNAGSANNGASVDIPAGDYVAIIKATSASINGKHRANVKLQYAQNGQRKSIAFLDKGEFGSLLDGRHAYEGLTLPFSHDGGTASFYFPIIPQKQAAGEVQITITESEPIVKEAVSLATQPPQLSQPRQRPRRTKRITQVSGGAGVCPMDTSHLRWYERGWLTGNCCGLVIDIGGQEYIVVKRSIVDDACGGGEKDSTPCISEFKDDQGHPSFAWPTLDGKTFASIPDVDQVFFRYDQQLNDLAAQKIASSEYNSPKGNPDGIRHLTFQLMTILFPVI